MNHKELSYQNTPIMKLSGLSARYPGVSDKHYTKEIKEIIGLPKDTI